MANLVAGETTLGGLQVSPYGSILSNFKVYTFTLTDASTVGANATAERTYTVTGLLADDIVVSVNWTPTTNLGIGGVRVSAANTLAVQWVNGTASATAPSAGGKTMTVVIVNSFMN